MSQGNDFANYPLSSNAAGGASEEVWFVAVSSDDIKQMNVDQLDEAFRLGIITTETAVWTEGMDAWAPLGKVADLEGEGGGSDAQSHADGASHAGGAELSQTLQSAGHANAGFGGGDFHGNDFDRNGSGYGAVAVQSAQSSLMPGPSSVAPVTSSYAPSPFAQSTGAVALNAEDDDAPAARGRRFRPERWALGAAAAVAVMVAVYNNMDLFSSSVASAGTQSPAPALAPRPYGVDGVDRGAAPAAPSTASKSADSDGEAAAPSKLAVADEAPSAAPVSKASASKTSAQDEEDETPAAAKKATEKDSSLRGSFSKAFSNKKPAAKAAKVKPRKSAKRAAKSRATKARKKPGVTRSQSAFDPLNDSLP